MSSTASLAMRVVVLCALVTLGAALWWVPVQQARVGPAARAEAFVALTICRNLPASAGASIPIRDLTRPRPAVTSHTPAQVTELASPFVTHFARGWWMELGAVALAAAGVLALVVAPVTGATLALASLAAFVALHGLNFEGYTLVKVAGLGHWWSAISAWDGPMIARLLLAPVAFVLLSSYVAWVLAAMVRRRGRDSTAQAPLSSTPHSTPHAART